MGALRAAELEAFGMIGVGQIFEKYRSQEFMDDDEVAVTHGPEELGYPALSQALVNIRSTLASSVKDGVISEETHASLLRVAKDTFFPKRGFKNLIEQARTDGIDRSEIEALEHWLPGNEIDQKQLDAIEMLKQIKEFASGNPPRKQVNYHVEKTYLFDNHVQSSGK